MDEFTVLPNALLRTKWAAALFIAPVLIGLVVALSQARSLTSLLLALPLAIPVGVLYVVYRGLAREGVARTDSEGLTIRAAFVRQSYRWEDVADVRIRTVGESGGVQWSLLDRFVAGSPGSRFVDLRLRRRLRWQLPNGRLGTRGFGIPTLRKTYHLALADPDAFVERAKSYLHQ